MSAQGALAKLEAEVLELAAGNWLRSIDELRALLAVESPEVRRKLLALVAPKIDRAALAGVARAFGIGTADALAIISKGGGKLGKRKSLETLRATADKLGGSRAAEGMVGGLTADATGALSKARKLTLAGVPLDVALAPLFANANAIRGTVTAAVNHASGEAVAAVSARAKLPTVWIAERNACVECLAYSGQVCQPGGTYPNGLTYGRKAYSATEGAKHPPKHPHCRCDHEPLLDQSYADALRREADRSVLKGFSLPNEGMGVRVDAAKRLLADPKLVAPKSVRAYSAKAAKAGKFPTRGEPSLEL